MRKIVKTFCLAMALMFTFTLVSCGEIDYTGVWKAVDVETSASVHMDAKTYMGKEFVITLEEDGSGNLLLGDETQEITWSKNDAGLELKWNNGKKTLTKDGDSLTMDFDNKGTIISFVKE